MKSFLKMLERPFEGWLGKRQQSGNKTNMASLSSDPLVKNRPLSFQESYLPLDDIEVADALFFRIRSFLFESLDKTQRRLDAETRSGMNKVEKKVILRETGKVSENKPYFFVQPLSKEGMLFERSGTGWVVSKANKIVSRDTFLRHYEPWDVVTLYVAKDGVGLPRVSSQRLSTDLVSFMVYEQKLVESLNL